MSIENYSVVTVAYQLRHGNFKGEVVEEMTRERPLKFIFGAGTMLPDFEVNLFGKEVGDTFDFVVHCDRGYGRFKRESIVDVPKSIFMIDGRLAEELLTVGTTIPINLEGKPLKGQILEIKATSVRIDFNHPMAGKHLHFKGEVLHTRMASKEEVSEKQVLN